MNDCIEWEGTRQRQGYGIISGQGVINGQLAHRVAYCEAHGLTIYDIAGQVVRHKCDNPPCVNPNHLELGTRTDNARDRDSRGRTPKGEAHCRAKLTKLQVQDIRSRYVPRCKVNGSHALAKEYGLSQSTISEIITRKIWKHLEESI